MKNSNWKKGNKSGFTLVELVIYIAIFATILLLIIGFLWMIVLGNIKETAYEEVQQNGRFAITKMTQEIKKATGIDIPTPGNSANALILRMADSSLTSFDISGGKLRMTKGINSYYLTTDQVIINNNSLQFTNNSYPNTPGIIQVKMEINHTNPGNRREYQASVDLESSVSLVPAGASPSLEIKKPMLHTDSTVWTTPARAYNYPDPNDQSDYGSDTSMPDRNDINPAILFYNWDQKTETYTTTVLKVNWRTNGRHSNDRFGIHYTKDGGVNWLDLVPMGVHNETTIQTSSANLDANQVLTSVQVNVVSDRVGGADGGTLYIYDIWTEGVF